MIEGTHLSSKIRGRAVDAVLTYQKPEREYYEIDEAARKKWLRYEVPKIRRAVKKYRGILYFQDESNISLTAFLGKTWSPRGQTPKANVTGKRAGVAATSVISRSGQLLFRLLDKRIASKEVIDFLGQMLRHHKRRHLIVVMDRTLPSTGSTYALFTYLAAVLARRVQRPTAQDALCKHSG